MAGKYDADGISTTAPASALPSSSASSSTKTKGDDSEVNWRKEVDTNVKRLHSLLFGADLALQKDDFDSAAVLGLRLVGFLDSRCKNDVDDTFIRPIRREALEKIDTARRSLVGDSDRQAFEQAMSGPGRIFRKTENFDMEKIKQSKYFQAVFHQSK